MVKTLHVLPSDKGWVVKREGTISRMYSTQKEAIQGARSAAKQSKAGQLVVHKKDGSVRNLETYGLPEVLDPPRKSRIGKKRVEAAVNKLVLDRLSAAPRVARD